MCVRACVRVRFGIQVKWEAESSNCTMLHSRDDVANMELVKRYTVVVHRRHHLHPVCRGGKTKPKRPRLPQPDLTAARRQVKGWGTQTARCIRAKSGRCVSGSSSTARRAPFHLSILPSTFHLPSQKGHHGITFDPPSPPRLFERTNASPREYSAARPGR